MGTVLFSCGYIRFGYGAGPVNGTILLRVWSIWISAQYHLSEGVVPCLVTGIVPFNCRFIV